MSNNISENKDILYYWDVLKKWERVILFNVVIITIIATIIAFILPKWYFSYSVITPNEDNGSSLISAVLSSKGLSSIGKNLNLGGFSYSDLDYYQSLLSSRKVTIEMIKKFDLQKVYDQEYLFKTINALLDNSDFQIQTRSNLLVIGVYDKEPVRAKEMVESYIEFLDSAVTEIKKTSLIYNSKFLENRYDQNVADLEEAQSKLEKFQEKYGVIVPEEQFIGTMKAYAEIEAQKLLLQSQLSGLLFSLDKNSPIIKTLNEQINALNSKLNDFSKISKNNEVKLFVSLGKAPELINKYVTYYRDVQIQSKLLELTYPLFQQAKMDEMRDNPPFIIIDKAFVPEYKTKPKRAIIILAGFGFSLILSIFFVFISEYINKLKSLRN